MKKDIWIFIALILLGAFVAYLDNLMNYQTILVETVHAIIVTLIFIFCLICQQKNPEIKQFGWNKILWGVAFLMIGSWVDILDDPPTLALLKIGHIPFGRSWEQSFLKKILGYSAGIGLIAYGFFQWVPWMIETRKNEHKLNQKLSQANKNLSRILMSLDEHVESERLHISRELHDDVAQQLTFLNFQLQLCQKEVPQDPEKALAHLKTITQDVSEALKSVRQISQDLRPESLYALGFIPALEQFLEKCRQQTPSTHFELIYTPLADTEKHIRIDGHFDERHLLHLFRVLQEGVRNAMKHSQAKKIEIIIQEKEGLFEFIIEDDGVGLPWKIMPSEELLVQEGHLGIAGLKERVMELSGHFNLENNPRKGARMEIVIQK